MTRPTVIGVLAMLAMAALSCSRPEAMDTASFVTLPEQGWMRGSCVSFSPEYGDSTACYDLTLTVRHTTDCPFRELFLPVDIIGENASARRQCLNLRLADDYGSWTGSGFGALYQCSTVLARRVTPREARTIVVWQAMDSVPVLSGVTEVGLTATLIKPR